MEDEVDEVFEGEMASPGSGWTGIDGNLLCLAEDNLMADILSCSFLKSRILRLGMV